MGTASPAVPEPRSVVITGASRGLGLASAAHLYQRGWRVVAAMRSPDVGLERLRAATGACAEDPRLVGVRLDLDDPSSIDRCRQGDRGGGRCARRARPQRRDRRRRLRRGHAAEALGAGLPHQSVRAGALTKALLPSMRAAGRGRIVVVSSQGGIRGMPAISAYSASKGALERWAEALAEEIAPFGLGVTILVSGTFQTDILTEQTPDYGDHTGRTRKHTRASSQGPRSRSAWRTRPSASLGARKGSRRAAPFARHAVGLDARCCCSPLAFCRAGCCITSSVWPAIRRSRGFRQLRRRRRR